MSESLGPESFASLFREGRRLIDVRAPVEFAGGFLPGACNLPLLEDAERAEVGTIYKQQGQEAAIVCGHRLISGSVKEHRLQKWLSALSESPDAIIYCFRGGLRSRTVQAWLKDRGVDRPLLKGGYKAGRRFLRASIDETTRSTPFLVISGPTGSGKTAFVQNVAAFRPVVDLEYLARHRGSAFGAMTEPQPGQVDFENNLAVELLRATPQLQGRPLVCEDESRMIGQRVVPESFFVQQRQSPIVWLEEAFDGRVENVFRDYIVHSPIGRGEESAALDCLRGFEESARAIGRKLGGLRLAQVLGLMDQGRRDFLAGRGSDVHREWISILLRDYYDPLYLRSLDRRQPRIFFRGPPAEALEKLRLQDQTFEI